MNPTQTLSRAACAAFALAAASARAQPAPSSATSATNQEVIQLSAFQVTTSADKGYRAGNSVSATRIDVPIKDLPFSVNAFTEQFITDIGARDLYDIVRYAPGVTSAGREFNAGNTRFNIRGFDQLTPQRNGFVGTAYVDTVNVQRVEIVKGPASILYGQIQPGGTVNYITKLPTAKRSAALSQQLGSDDFWRTTLDLNQPIAGETLALRFNAALENGAQHIDPSKTRTWVIAPTLSWKPTASSSLTVDYQWFRRNESPPVFMKPNIRIAGLATAYTSPDGKSFTPIDYGFGPAYPLPDDFNYVGKNDFRDADFEALYLQYAIKLNANWNARANFQWGRRAVKNKLTGIADARIFPNGITMTSTGAGYTTLGGTATVEASGLARISGTSGSFAFNPRDGSVLNGLQPGAWALLPRRARIQEEFGQSRAYQVELAGNYNFDGVSWKPLFGGFHNNGYSKGRTREQGDFYLPWNLLDPRTWVDVYSPAGAASPARLGSNDYEPGLLPETASSESWGKDTAYYTAQSFGFFKDRLLVVAGARYNKAESRGDNRRQAPDPTTAAGRNEIKNNNWTEVSKTIYQGGAGFKVLPDLMVYASYSESFVVDTRFLQFRGELDTAAKPSTAEGVEAGVKSDLLQGRLSATVSVFEINQFDRVLNFSERVGAQSLTTQLQGAEDTSKGWEIETTVSPLDNWQVYASFSQVDTKLTKVPVGLEPLLGARPEASVKHLFNVWTRYSFTQAPLKGFWIGGGANYTGEKAQRVDNRLLRMPEYTLWDATVGYDGKWRDTPYSASLAWKNITDEEYFPANQQRGFPSRLLFTISARF